MTLDEATRRAERAFRADPTRTSAAQLLELQARRCGVDPVTTAAVCDLLALLVRTFTMRELEGLAAEGGALSIRELHLRSRGGRFDLVLTYRGQRAELRGLTAGVLKSPSRMRSRALSEGLLLPILPRQAWEDALARAWPHLKRSA